MGKKKIGGLIGNIFQTHHLWKVYKNLLCSLGPSTINTGENIIRHEKPSGKSWKMTLQEGCGCWLRKK